MPIRIKKLGQKGGPKGQDKTIPLPKKKPRLANPRHPMNAEKTKRMASGGMSRSQKSARIEKLLSQMQSIPNDKYTPKSDSIKLLKIESEIDKLVGKKTGGVMKKAAGGKLKMVEKGGKKVPFFAADGKGKMAMGGMMKKKGMAKGGMMKKGYAKGGPVTVRSGDTLSQIAKSKGLTLASLMAANPGIKNANQIRVGQSIKMPTGGAKSRAQGIAKKKGVYGDTSKPVMSALARDTAARKAAKAGKPVSKAKTVKDPKIARKIATTATKLSNLGQVNKNRRADDAAAKPKASTKKTLANTPKSGAAKVAETRMARLANKNKLARRAGGGMMKKKGMAKGGMMKKKGYAMGGMMKKKGMAKGGVMRGTGAATKGKRFGRAG